MMHRMFAGVALGVAIGCSNGATPPESRTGATPPSSPDAFAGSWRSVTPSFEFIRLTVASKSSEQGALAARLTFSGVAWEGDGRIDGDSVLARMTMAGTATSSGVLVARARDARTLRVQVRPVSAAALDLTFVREE